MFGVIWSSGLDALKHCLSGRNDCERPAQHMSQPGRQRPTADATTYSDDNPLILYQPAQGLTARERRQERKRALEVSS